MKYEKQIQGGKGGGSKHTPVETPDNLNSVDSFRILDLISEGEIQGLVNGTQSVFFDETPMTGTNGENNFPGATVQFRSGTPNQSIIKGFDSAENTVSSGVELKHSTPWVQGFSNLGLSAVSVTLGVPRLESTNADNGDRNGSTINYTVDLSTNGGAYQRVVNGNIVGKTTTEVHREHRIDLPQSSGGWQIKVTRSTPDSTSDTLQNKTTIVSYTEIVDGEFSYPDCALVGATGNAKQFSSVPSRSYDMWGRIIRVPSNYEPETRTYTGAWDGTFHPRWTDNPAWVLYDLITHERYGLGHLVDERLLDKFFLYTISKYCDEMVSDGLGGLEPRFTCNAYLQTQQDAYKLINDLSSIFRGITFWAGGSIVAHADMPENPSYTYTNANVVGGRFTYTSSPRSDRYSVAHVSWNDPRNFMKQKVETEEYSDGIERYGYREKEVTAFACTSQGQARRYGRWLTRTSCLLTNMVNFSVGLEGLRSLPGDVIQVSDAHRMGKRQAGRIRSSSDLVENDVHKTVVVIDSATDVAPGDILFCNMPDGGSQSREVESVDGQGVKTTSAFSVLPASESVWSVSKATLQAQKFRVVSIKEDDSEDSISYEISAVEYNESIYGAVETDLQIVQPPISALRPNAVVKPQGISLDAAAVKHHGASTVQVTISWGRVDGASGYEVEYRINDGLWVSAGKDVPGTSVDFYNARAGSYDARVRTVSTSGDLSKWGRLNNAILVTGPDPYFTGGTLAGDKINADVGDGTIASTEYVQQNLVDYVNATVYNDKIADLQDQIDGQIDSFFYEYDPTLSNAPASTWTSSTIKDRHLGDTFTNVKTGHSWRFAKVGSEYSWTVISDAAVSKALSDAAKALDTADHKRRVFIDTPYPPYDPGDLWAQNQTIKVALTGRAEGDTYRATDWNEQANLGATEAYVDEAIGPVKRQVDGAVTSWFFDYVPSTSNFPVSDWNALDKANHEGDTFTQVSTGSSWRWNGSSWDVITDTATARALQAAGEAKDTADNKRRVFTDTPFGPYDSGDLWLRGDGIWGSDTHRNTGYTASDWSKRGDITGQNTSNNTNNVGGRTSGKVNSDLDQAASDAAYAKQQADAAKAQAAIAISQLQDVGDDGKLTPAEQIIVKLDWVNLRTQQSGIDAQADAFGVSRSSYDSKISALRSYLNGLGLVNSSGVWGSTIPTVTINRATWNNTWDDAYNARQDLLNAVAAKAKAVADGAQNTANTAHALASQVNVINPGFDAGDTGWTKEGGWSIKQDGSFGDKQGYAEHQGSTTNQTKALRNQALCFVEPGHSYKVQALIRGVNGPNGSCYARISWLDINKNEISGGALNTNGNLVSGNGVAGSYATGVAPSGAIFARAEVATANHKYGQYQVDNVVSTLVPATAAEISETDGRHWAAQPGADKTATSPQGSGWLTDSSDLARGGDSITRFGDRTADHISETSGRRFAAESGATVGARWGQNITNQPTSLSGINSSEGSKLGAIETGATKGAKWGDNITNQPTSLSGINSSEGSKLGGIEAGATVGANWYDNVFGRPQSNGNLIHMGDFNDPSSADIAGNWTGTGNAVKNYPGGQPFGNGMQVTSGIVYEEFNYIPCRPGDTFFFDVWVSGGVKIGMQVLNSGKHQITEAVAVSHSGGGWQRKIGSCVASSGSSAYVRPYVRGNGAGYAAHIMCATAEPGATVGADWYSNLGRRPVELTDGRIDSAINEQGGYRYAAQVFTSASGGPKLGEMANGIAPVGYVDGQPTLQDIAATVVDTSGGSGGGGGTGTPPGGWGCPMFGEWVIIRGKFKEDVYIRVEELKVGDRIKLMSGGWARVIGAKHKTNGCLRVTMSDGSTLQCSADARLEMHDGFWVRGHSCLGSALKRKTRGEDHVEQVVKAEPIGIHSIVHVTVKGRDKSFQVGHERGVMFGHHNLKQAQ